MARSWAANDRDALGRRLDRRRLVAPYTRWGRIRRLRVTRISARISRVITRRRIALAGESTIGAVEVAQTPAAPEGTEQVATVVETSGEAEVAVEAIAVE